MPIEKPTIWTGESGTDYLYYVCALDEDVPSRRGNFIYAKKNEEASWVPLFMGEGDLAVRCDDPARLACIKAKGATNVHLRLNKRDEDRGDELLDLLRRYGNAFDPDGCHTEAERPAPLDASSASSEPAAS